MMDGWADYLHTSLGGEHALFPALRLTSFGTFTAAAVLSASICLAERCARFAPSLFLSLEAQQTQRSMTFDSPVR